MNAQHGKEVDIIATLIFPGGYRDQAGHEAISWRVEGSRRYGLPHMEIFTAIRGTDLWGFDFDGLEPVDSSAGAEHLSLNQAGELGDCVLSGDLPCTVPGLWSDVACPSWR